MNARLGRIRRPPVAATVLGSLLVASLALRSWAALTVVSPWMSPDEESYAALGRSLWHGDGLTVLGRHVGYLSLFYPLVVGLPLSLFDTHLGYDLAKVLQAALMTATAIPVYLWSRSLMPRAYALLAAGLTLTLPGLAFSGFLMTETLFYPVFVLTAWAMAATLVRPTLRNQALLSGALVLAVGTRLQAVVLVPAFLLAVALLFAFDRRRGVVRALAPFLIGVAVLTVAWLVVTLASGRSPMGAYGVVGSVSYSLGAALRFAVYHLADVVLLVAFVPAVALAILAVEAARGREESDRVRAFLAVALALTAALVAEVGLFTSRLLGRLGERYLLGLAPLLFIGLALWLSRGAPRPRVTTVATLLAALALLAILPVRFFSEAAEPDAFSAIPLYHLSAAYPGTDVRFFLFAVAVDLALLFLLVPRRYAWTLAAATALLLVVTSFYVSRIVADQARGFESVMVGPQPAWIDRYAEGPVAFVYANELSWSGGSPVWVNEFWNRRIDRVYVLNGAVVDGPMPVSGATLQADHTLSLDRPTSMPPPSFVVTGPGVVPLGTRIATTANGAWTLWRLRSSPPAVTSPR
jgi:Dolichyl-phosphate-mannose-protein mannosyltransferase